MSTESVSRTKPNSWLLVAWLQQPDMLFGRACALQVPRDIQAFQERESIAPVVVAVDLLGGDRKRRARDNRLVVLVTNEQWRGPGRAAPRGGVDLSRGIAYSSDIPTKSEVGQCNLDCARRINSSPV